MTEMSDLCHLRKPRVMTMQPISDDMLTMSEICVAVAKCERAIR